MKINISGLLFFFILVFVVASPAPAEFKRTKIAVLDFQLQGARHDSTDMGKIVAEWLITALVKEGRFDVIERRLLEKVLEEQKIGASGIVDESSASKLGRVLGAKVVITGSVLEFQNILEVNARIIEVESSSIIAAENVKSTSAVKLEDLVVQMADRIISDFPLEGYIVQREGNNVLIDLGRRTGVKKGMQFIVYQEGRVIKHPKTGEILDIERIQTGTIEITDVKLKTAGGIVRNETAENAITSGQLVKSNVELVALNNSVQPEEATNKRRGREHPVGAEPDADLLAQLAGLNARIADVKTLKENGSSGWKEKFREALAGLKSAESRNRRSPEVQLGYAKLFSAIGKPGDAEKYARKALSLRPRYGEAYIVKGDIDFETIRKMKPKKRRKLGKQALQDYETALEIVQDGETLAMIYYKLGNVYADLQEDADKAREYWQKAVNTAPFSDAARLAKIKI